MQLKMRVQAIHYASAQDVIVQFQGVDTNASFSVTRPRTDVKGLEVGTVGTLTFEPEASRADG